MEPLRLCRLEVAARFELEQLRWYVCKCLIGGLTPENAVESLSLAKTFRLKLLHSVALRFLYDVWELLGPEVSQSYMLSGLIGSEVENTIPDLK